MRDVGLLAAGTVGAPAQIQGHLAFPIHRIAQMEHPVALDDHLGILEHQVAVGEGAEERLPWPETTGTMSIATWSMSPSDSACLPTSPAPTPIFPSPASSSARAIPSCTEVAKWYDASGFHPVGRDGATRSRRDRSPAGGLPSRWSGRLVPPDDQDLLPRPQATLVVSRGR